MIVVEKMAKSLYDSLQWHYVNE